MTVIAPARADDEPGTGPSAVEEPPSTDEEPKGDREFGPLLVIERIDITGNTATLDEVIRRAVPIAPGDMLRASDKRLTEARFKVLALGYFRDVGLAMHKGSRRGHVIVEVHVVERGTVVLNRLWFGTNSLTPYWVGADVGERNLLGLGIGLGGGFIYAAHGDVDGSRAQWATELRLSDPSLLGSRFGANVAGTIVRGSEAYRIAGTDGTPALRELRAFPYRRFGVRANLTYDADALTRLSAGVRLEQISTELPVAPTLLLPDQRVTAIDLHLDPGTSYVITAGLSYDRDTRPDPILPHAGAHLAFAAELGSPLVGSDYQFATLFGRYEHYWPKYRGRHAIALKIAGGVVIGDAPRFDRIHLADVNRMLTPRAMGMVLSTAAPLALLQTRPDKPTYGDLGGAITVEYAMRLFRGKGENRVYGGDLFLGAGVWGLAENIDLRARDATTWSSLPIDVYIDAGIRFDTDVGIFEITLANGLGRLR
ncbi:MAG: BamA/TamA family outer membrane protein [Deltaproteobacteria bacterium]|nr:BamA/TamA family outer membrane protein [Deltaproteobacteria bacterium]